MPQILENGGRGNTVTSVCKRYFMSQAFVAKAGDIFFKDPDDEDKVKVLAVYQHDGAEMCFNRSAILVVLLFVKAAYGEDLSAQKFFEDPANTMDLAMLEGKEELMLIHYTLTFL